MIGSVIALLLDILSLAYCTRMDGVYWFQVLLYVEVQSSAESGDHGPTVDVFD